jgi:hypothetical protein
MSVILGTMPAPSTIMSEAQSVDYEANNTMDGADIMVSLGGSSLLPPSALQSVGTVALGTITSGGAVLPASAYTIVGDGHHSISKASANNDNATASMAFLIGFVVAGYIILHFLPASIAKDINNFLGILFR